MESGASDIKFCQKLGGCFHKLPPAEKKNLLDWLEFFRNCARAHAKGKIKTPASRTHSLLAISCPPIAAAGSSNDPPALKLQTFIMCQVSLKPLGMCLWECTSRYSAGQSLSPGSSCPASFQASLDFDVLANGWRYPKLMTMHQFAYRQRGLPIRDSIMKMILESDYEVVSLNSVLVRDVGSLLACLAFAGRRLLQM